MADLQLQDLPLSLSPEYCKNWTKDRAISELVANAIDEKRPFSYKWKDGVLVIEDEANGLPRSSLVLGLSGKNDKQIGQFGEGLDIACLVLARTNTPMKVETVGYSFEPFIQHDPRLDTEVLHIRFLPPNSKRVRGTRISVTCPEALSEKVKSRFLQLGIPGYKGPGGTGTIIKDGKGGRVFIGGVLVQENTSLLLSYDLSTQAAKKLQNRDRSVIDAQERRSLIDTICRTIEDPEVLEKLVVGAQEGKGEYEEMSFANEVAPKQRKALLEIRKKLFGDVRIAILETYDQEANLLLKDYRYTLVGGDKDHKLAWVLQKIYKAMDIPMASEAARTMSAVRKDGKKKTKKEIEKEVVWTKEKTITQEERKNLDWSLALARGLFGAQAVGEVKVYESRRLDPGDPELGHGGYYDPKGSGLIMIKHSLLDSRRETFATLGHEVGHRRRHRVHWSDYADRTRGFESELTDMIGALGEVVAEAGIDPGSLRPTLGSDVVYPGGRGQVPKGVVTPATVASDLFKQAMAASGYTSQRQLAEATYVKPSQLSRIFQTQASPPSYPDLEAACEAVGLNPAVVGLAKTVEHFHFYRNRALERGKNVFPSGSARRNIETLVQKLSEDPRHAEKAAEVKALMTGPFKLIDKEDLVKPFMAMLETEKEQLALRTEEMALSAG